MANINSVILMGSVVDVGQLRYSGQLAILDIPLTLFGERAVAASDLLRVGRQVVVRGEINCQEKESKQTGKVYLVMEVRVTEMQIV